MTLRARIAQILLWLTMLALGILLGGNTYEQTVIKPAWQSALPDSLRLWRDILRINGLPFYPFVVMPAIVLSIAALIVGWSTGRARRKWMTAAAACAPVVLASTVIFFVPVLGALFREEAADGRSLAEIQSLTQRFNVMSWMRWFVVLTGFIASVRALNIPPTTITENLKQVHNHDQ